MANEAPCQEYCTYIKHEIPTNETSPGVAIIAPLRFTVWMSRQQPRSSYYTVGDRIGPWPIFATGEQELIAGRDCGHLDFRLSVLKETTSGVPSVVISTVCTVHDRYSMSYLFFVVPFHRWGVRWLMERAIRAGRL